MPRYREDFSDAKRAVGKSTGVARLKNNFLDHAATQRAPWTSNTGKCQAFETVTPQRKARREIAAGNAGHSIKMFLINYDATRAVGLPLAMPGKIETFLKTNRRDAVSCCYEYYGYFKALHVMKQKVIFVYPFNQLSNFSLT